MIQMMKRYGSRRMEEIKDWGLRLKLVKSKASRGKGEEIMMGRDKENCMQ